MNIQAEKLNLIEWISKLRDTSIIDKLREIKNEYANLEDQLDTLKEEELESINRGLKDIDAGMAYSHETAKKIYEKYL